MPPAQGVATEDIGEGDATAHLQGHVRLRDDDDSLAVGLVDEFSNWRQPRDTHGLPEPALDVTRMADDIAAIQEEMIAAYRHFPRRTWPIPPLRVGRTISGPRPKRQALGRPAT